MGLKIQRWLETRRAPQKKDYIGGEYTPSGIDIYTTHDPELIKIGDFGDDIMRVEDLLSAMEELNRYERRRKMSGEKIEVKIELIEPDKEGGDVYHFPSHATAKPDPDHKGLIVLEIPYDHSTGMKVLTAYRDSLREALENRQDLAKLEREDQERHR